MKPRFIAAGLDLLGLEGSSYRFFSDPWLAGPTTFRPISPRPADRKIVVSDLINPTSSSWHITTVNSLFLSIDTLLIFSIPLSNLSRKDKGVWFYENSGAYTVRSGYRFTVRQQYSQGSSDSSILNPWSKPLWGVFIAIFSCVLHRTKQKNLLSSGGRNKHRRDRMKFIRCSNCGKCCPKILSLNPGWLGQPVSDRFRLGRLTGKLFVSDLINPTSSSWHIAAVNSLFFSIDTLLIFSIPLSNLSREDKRVWFCDNSGAYTVRSWYIVLLSINDIHKGLPILRS
ncbi:hypothetical protein ACOSQ4_028523 [Xanthoceras sorbifolium]